jgi:hypothetical protein
LRLGTTHLYIEAATPYLTLRSFFGIRLLPTGSSKGAFRRLGGSLDHFLPALPPLSSSLTHTKHQHKNTITRTPSQEHQHKNTITRTPSQEHQHKNTITTSTMQRPPINRQPAPNLRITPSTMRRPPKNTRRALSLNDFVVNSSGTHHSEFNFSSSPHLSRK